MIMTEKLINALWDHVEPMMFITKEEFVASLGGWAIEGFEKDGRLNLITLTKGPEFHFFTLGDGNRFSMKEVRGFLQPIIDRHGFVRTKTQKDDLRQQRFNRLIGFEAEGESEFSIHYKMEKFRRVECLS